MNCWHLIAACVVVSQSASDTKQTLIARIKSKLRTMGMAQFARQRHPLFTGVSSDA
jgi:hypothetical protein